MLPIYLRSFANVQDDKKRTFSVVLLISAGFFIISSREESISYKNTPKKEKYMTNHTPY